MEKAEKALLDMGQYQWYFNPPVQRQEALYQEFCGFYCSQVKKYFLNSYELYELVFSAITGERIVGPCDRIWEWNPTMLFFVFV